MKAAAFTAKSHDRTAVTLFQNSVRFILDSGCTKHMCASRSKFDTFKVLPQPVSIEVADGNFIHAVAMGTIGLLTDVYYVPQLRRNLISISAFDKQGYGILFEQGHAYMRSSPNEEFQLVGVLDGALYEAGNMSEHIHDEDLIDQPSYSSEMACTMVEHLSD